MNYDERFSFKEITENPIILNLTDCETLLDIHLLLKEKFGFPEYYGKNWDALWDLMQDVFSDDDPYTVEIHGFHSLNKELQKNCEMMFVIFDRVAQTTTGFTYKIR